MKVEVDVTIDAPKEAVWHIISDIEHAADTITGIEQVEILEKPDDGLVGLKWRETRTLFGKTATEVMWITDARELEFYATRAESHGAVYLTRLGLTDEDGKTRLRMEFAGTPQTLGAKVMSAVTGWAFKNATQKALMQDLVDIKAKVEHGDG